MADSRSIASVDQELLSTLERVFALHAGADAAIDPEELQRALGLKSEYLARRVLKAFDRDGNGKVDRGEFVSAVRGLVFGTEAEKLQFAFRLHDDDGDGFISELEMLRMISISLAESDLVSRKSQPPERLARVVFKAADRDQDGRVSFDEFAAVMRAYPDLLQKITRAEAQWIAPNEELLGHLTHGAGAPAKRLRHRLENSALDVLAVAVWLGVNLLLFWNAFAEGRGLPEPDPWLALGRGLAACLSFNGALVFVPILRRLFARLRRSWLGRKLSVDAAVDVHRYLGQLLFVLACLHALAYVASYRRGHAALGIGHLLGSTRLGASGAALLAVFFVMWLFAQSFVRRSKRFELFYATHSLYWVWIVLLLVHAPSFALWAGVPLALLLVENLGRRRRRGQRTTARAVALRSGVTRVDIDRPLAFQFQPSDYLFLNIPHLAKHEWHPFTLSSAPEIDALSVRVRSLGNWTSALRRDAEQREARGDRDFVVRIDGPYGSPTAHLFAARSAVLIGAGIGVTPFASVLDSLSQRAASEGPGLGQLSRLHFFWLNRDQVSFEWFADLLERLERGPLRDLLQVHICMTGGRATSSAAALEIARAILHAGGNRDLVTGLHTKTHMGHPDWDVLLGAIASEAAPEPVDVIFCGPPGLGRKLRRACARAGLRFHEEKF